MTRAQKWSYVKIVGVCLTITLQVRLPPDRPAVRTGPDLTLA